MALDTSGSLLEGIRISAGNDGFTFPPRDFVSDQAALDSVPGRAEYVLIASSTDPAQKDADIADTTLRFRWTKNESTILRFDYDNYSRRWMPSPGGPPDEVGPLSNDPRLAVPVPDEDVTDAPFTLYVGSPVRAQTFTFQFVGEEGDFSPPPSLPAGTVELARLEGTLNFSQADLSAHGGSTVYFLRQGFFDRLQTNGSIGELPSSVTDYYLFLNPKPDTGQSPRVRIDYRPLLVPVEVPDEASLGTPSVGTFHWSLDTGRVRFAPADVSANLQLKVYYDGVTMGEVQLVRTSLGSISAYYPAPAFNVPGAVGLTDPVRFAVFAESGQSRYYFKVGLISSPPGRAPRRGNVYLDVVTGNLYFSMWDVFAFAGWTASYLDTVAEVEDGVSVQFYRSGVNEVGAPQAPDFRIAYAVSEQVVVDGIRKSPFVMLPTTPLVDDNLEFKIARGPSSSGTFTGILADGRDPSLSGYGYLLNLDAHQLKFSNRRSVTRTLLRPLPSVKLDDAAISPLGFEASRNGSPITPGVDFDFDPDTGLMEFLEPVGENDPRNVIGVVGLAVDVPPLPSVGNQLQGPADEGAFQSDSPAFSPSNVGMFLLVLSGDNRGIYEITSYVGPSEVKIAPPFPSPGSDPVTADLKADAEVIADRFWTEFRPPYKKFSLAKAGSPSGSFTILSNAEYDVFKNTGQVNLKTPALPGEAYQITYVANETDDDGATFNPVNKVENALFKVRQETATPVGGSSGPVPDVEKKFGAVRKTGTSTFTFNPEGRTVNTARDITVYVNGMLLEPADFTYEAPGTIKTADVVGSDQVLVLDYWVEDALGGETNFNLLSDAVDLDTPEVVKGEQDATYNGDQTGVLSPGSAMFIGETEVMVVQSSEYDPGGDVTNVSFEAVPTVSSEGANILVTGPVTGSRFRVAEAAAVDVFVQGTNALYVSGSHPEYVTGTLVTVDGDPYSVLNSVYEEAAGRTKVVTSGPAKRNYILPSVTKTVRPILFPGAAFRTSKPANISLPFNLVRMGTEQEVLIRDVDYVLSEGGDISLNIELQFGDQLVATYVARKAQPFGSSFSLNYSYAIAPDQANGIAGQRLLATYNLYAPDTFFYRIETVESFIPEVVDLLQSSASSGASGPNTGDATGRANKDYGSPSLYFEEQHQGNFDIVIARLLKLYNDLINTYEDLLSDLDGRIVGGNSGRFRFDGKFDNPVRSSYGQVTNDVDDTVKLYDTIQLTGFFSFALVPVYGTMAVPNALSRIFPTVITKTAMINDQTGFFDLGNTMGSFGQSNIRSPGFIYSTRANSFFDSVDPSGMAFIIPRNGDVDNKLPPFSVDQDVDVYSLDGIRDVSAKVVSADMNEPATVIIDTPATVTEGSLLRDSSDAGNTENHFYAAGRDLVLDHDNGQIINFTLPPPLDVFQNEVIGNELVSAALVFGNTDTAPRRPPVLDGGELNDDGRVPEPRLRRIAEDVLLDREVAAYSTLGNARVRTDKVTVEGSTIQVVVGKEVTFLNGVNAGAVRTVLSVIDATTFTVSPPFPNADPAGSDFEITSEPRSISVVLTDLLGILDDNVAGPPANPSSLISVVNSEIRSAEAAVACWGPEIASGTGTTTSLVLSDGSADFVSAGVNTQSLLFVPSGGNRGLYKIASVTSTTVMADGTPPYSGFPSPGSTPYAIIRPESFLSTDQFDFMTEFLRETLEFLANTRAFAAAPTASGKLAREGAVDVRRSRLSEFMVQLEGILIDGKLYDTRFLWIDQRTNRKEGTRAKRSQAAAQRVANQAKLVADQQKALIAMALTA